MFDGNACVSGLDITGKNKQPESLGPVSWASPDVEQSHC